MFLSYCTPPNKRLYLHVEKSSELKSYLFLLTKCMNFVAFPFFLWRDKIKSSVQNTRNRVSLTTPCIFFQREGNIGYAHWVCSSLLPDKSPENHVILKGHPVPTLSHLHPEYRKAVLQSSTALSKYTGQDTRIAEHFDIGKLKKKDRALTQLRWRQLWRHHKSAYFVTKQLFLCSLHAPWVRWSFFSIFLQQRRENTKFWVHDT